MLNSDRDPDTRTQIPAVPFLTDDFQPNVCEIFMTIIKWTFLCNDTNFDVFMSISDFPIHFFVQIPSVLHERILKKKRKILRMCIFLVQQWWYK